MESPNRQSIRLSGYDYSQSGYYFVTICTQNRQCLFGNITNNKTVVTNTGNIIKRAWKTLPQHHPVELDIFQIMPNHIHFIIQIVRVVRAQPVCGSDIARNDSGIARNAPTKFGHVVAGSLPSVVRSFKSETTKQIRRLIGNPNLIIWQRNYYERIIRDEIELNKTREYVKLNPQNWEKDQNNPASPRI